MNNSTFVNEHGLPLASFYADARVVKLLESIPAGVVIHGSDTKVLYANLQACKILGLSTDQIHGRLAPDSQWQFVNEHGEPLALEHYPVNQVLNSSTPLESCVIGMSAPQSGIRWALCNGYADLDDQGVVTGAVISFIDITQLRRSQQALMLAEERYRLILEGARDGLWDWDMANNQVFYSDRWFEMLGYHPGEIPSTPDLWLQLCHPDDLQLISRTFARVLSQPSESMEFEARLRHKHEHYVPVLTRARIVRDTSGKAIRMAGSNQDLTERKRYEQQIQQLAFNDPLTGLPNRRYLQEQIARAILACARSQQFGALMFIDLDHFKELNDALGHHEGDELLKKVAEQLQSLVRGTDTVARLGGDEFIMLIENLGADKSLALKHAQELGQKALDALHKIDTPLAGYQVMASIGITFFDKDANSIDDLLRQADTAMYHAKTDGRNRLYVAELSPSS
ncbi:MAG: diguanylate cyclase [Pseudohongiella sp.]|nr:diguanylate cyclase [Pseudohongiella sp.]